MNRKLLVLATAVLLNTGLTYAAPRQKSPAKAAPAIHKTQPTHTTSGTVSSVNSSELTLSPGNGKKGLTFALAADTQRPTNLANGDSVIVHYRVENKQNMATSIQMAPSKSAGNTAKKKS